MFLFFGISQMPFSFLSRVHFIDIVYPSSIIVFAPCSHHEPQSSLCNTLPCWEASPCLIVTYLRWLPFPSRFFFVMFERSLALVVSLPYYGLWSYHRKQLVVGSGTRGNNPIEDDDCSGIIDGCHDRKERHYRWFVVRKSAWM